MKSLICILLLLLLHCSSISATAFNISLDNSTSQFCVGQHVRFICDITGIDTFVWTVPGSLSRSEGGVITTIQGGTTFNEFNLTAVTGSSTLLFKIFAGLNNTDITCEGAVGATTQSTLTLQVQIFGMTCPSISAIGYSNFTGVTVALMNRPMCVQEYSVNVTGGDEVRSVSISNDEVVIPLALCNFAYDIVVTAMFIEGFEICPSVEVSFPVEGIGDLNVTANGNVVSWFVTSDTLMDCISGYRLTDGANRIMDVPKTQTTFNLSSYNNDRCTIGSVTVTALIVDRETGVYNTVTLCNVTTTTMLMTSPTTVSTAPPAETGSSSPSSDFPWWIIVVIVLVVVGTVSVIAIIICCWKWRQHQARARSKQAEASAQMMQYDDKQQEQMKQQQADTHDFIPTYQDVSAIQRETVGPSNDVYTVVDKKKPKGSKKKSEKKEDEMPMYSMVNKDKNSTDGNPEGLVYTEVSVQSSSKSSRSRPPPPPGVAQLDANEPVVYSTVETPQQRH